MYQHQRSGLNLTLFRAYSPSLARWLSRDPLGESMGANLYAYVGNNPAGAIDPLGLQYDPVPWSSLGQASRSFGGSGNLVANINLNVRNGSYIVLDAYNVAGPWYIGKGPISRAMQSMGEKGFSNWFWTPCPTQNRGPELIESERMYKLGGPLSEKLPFNKYWPKFSPHSSLPPYRGPMTSSGIFAVPGFATSDYIYQWTHGNQMMPGEFLLNYGQQPSEI